MINFNLKPNDKIPLFNRSAFETINDSLMILRVHGFLTDSENDKCCQRVEKWLKHHSTKEPNLYEDSKV